jgi:hypothetical protein
MRSTPPATKRQGPPIDGSGGPPAPAGDDPTVQLRHLQRIEAAMAACDAMGDSELARHAGRKLLAALACGADALLLDGAGTLHSAPDKVAAFFDKAAAGFAATIEGLHKRAVLLEAAAGHPATLASRGPLALDAREITAAPPRLADPLADAIAAWSDRQP